MMVAALAATIVLGLTSCGSSDAGGDETVPVTAPAVTAPVITEPAATVEAAPVVEDTTAANTTPEAMSETSVPTGPSATDAVAQSDDDTLVVTDAEVADLEKQLDEIDQLLAGIDADLSQD